MKEQDKLTEEEKIKIRREHSKNAPEENDRSIQQVKNRLVLNIKAKESLEDLLHEQITEAEFAFILSKDKELRQTVQKVTEGIINPDPVGSLKAERDAVGFDFVHGLSTFWDEMRAPLDEKVDVAVKAKEIANQVEAGMNQRNTPTARREILSNLGIDNKEMSVLVPPEDDARYQKEVVDHYRNEHMERLGFKEDDILDPADELLINNLVEDSMAMPDGFRIDIVPDTPKNLVDPYVEEYGMTAEEFNKSFGYADEVTQYDYPAYENLHQIDDFPTMKFALEEYERIHDAPLEDNVDELAEIERIESVINSSRLSLSDLEDLEQHAPPELSENDLINLEEWDNLQM